jgi:hypothetical protein
LATRGIVVRSYIQRVIARLGIIGELLAFFWERKLWWMIPMVLVLMLFGVLIVFTQGTALAPFVYTLF